MDDNEDDDIDTFTLKLNDEMKDYKVLKEQENTIELSKEDSALIPSGMSIATVSEPDEQFMTSTRKFFVMDGGPTTIEIPLVAPLKDGELALVFMWDQGALVNGKNVEYQDLDLHVEFQASETTLCTVDYTMR